MSVDPAQITAQTVASPPSPDPAPKVDTLHEAITAIVEPRLAPIVAPLVSQLADAVTTDVGQAKALATQAQSDVQGVLTTVQDHDGLIGILQQQANAHSAQINALEQKVGSALVKAAVDNAKAIVLILVVGSVVALVMLFGFYLAGSHTAADTVLAIPGGAAALAAGLTLYFRQPTNSIAP